ncbi:MAG: acyl-CoA dehydrogenase [Betaproteobacteria bacterium]|nr:acyl-CoA dehydrogenase [Betaproteobacteria bacterium]
MADLSSTRSDLLLSRRDLDFLLYEWLDAASLAQRGRFSDHARETFDAVLDLSTRLATEFFAPHNKKSDAHEPRQLVDATGDRVQMIPEIKAAVDVFSAAGLLAASQDAELGGMQLPVLIEKACMAYFMAANVATAAYPFLTMGNANLLCRYGTPAQIEAYVRPMLAGRFFGTMCLSEPQAGSSLADIKTRAEPQPDGSFRLFGNKMWISAGEHELGDNIVHLVLARIAGAAAGVKGISLFIVPKRLVNADGSLGERNDIALAGLNHKMGYRGTTNCLLNFGEGKYCPAGAAGAVGYLVGQPHQGLAYMFHMMNEARIGVGLGATALGYTGYLHALDYARNRPQGRPLHAKDPQAPQVPIIEHSDVRRMLLAQKSYVEGALALNLYCAKLVDEEKTAPDATARRDATLLLDILTPIAKSWPSQWCLEANSLAIQVHGGYGYTRDYNVEQFYRDNRLNPIHEGTHGIQGLDLLGRKVVMQEGAAFWLLGRQIAKTIARAQAATQSDTRRFASELAMVTERLGAVTRALHNSGRIELTLANASVYLEALGHIVIAWMWLEQSLAAAAHYAEHDSDFYQGKWQACRYFFVWELPKVKAMLNLLESLDDTTLAMQPAWF